MQSPGAGPLYMGGPGLSSPCLGLSRTLEQTGTGVMLQCVGYQAARGCML